MLLCPPKHTHTRTKQTLYILCITPFLIFFLGKRCESCVGEVAQAGRAETEHSRNSEHGMYTGLFLFVCLL